MTNRLARLRAELETRELDAMLVSSSENRQYMSGFDGSAGYLLVTQSDAVLATDFRYTEQAEAQAPDYRIHRIRGPLNWFPELAAELGASRIGFESEDVTVQMHTALLKAVDESDTAHKPEMVPTTELVARLRELKDAQELALLSKAIEIADEAMDEVAPRIEPGMTEAQVAWDMEMAMRKRGAEMISFDTIVGAGPNGAMAHHRADDTVIKDGDAIVIDMGAKYEGYCSDLTRTVVVGEASEKLKEIYNIVLRAQLEAEDKVRAGMTGEEVDALARDVIADAGYGDDFGHSLGHGVGLAVHEYPRVAPRVEDKLEDGMVFTIEPGIYLPGWGGVRIEDIVVLENGRARVISSASKMEL